MKPTLSFAKAMAGAAAVVFAAAAPAAQEEAPAPPDPFTITLGAGQRFTGAAARLDIRHLVAGQPPLIEIALSASDAAGRTWAARAVAPSNFAQKLSLEVRVTDRPLAPGDASVQGSASPDADAVFASTGTLKLWLRAGRLVGEAKGAGAFFPAVFEGPVAVSCAAPASATAAGRPTPIAADAPVALVVDEAFETALCQPYAAWAGGAR